MGWISDLFGAPQAPIQQVPNIQIPQHAIHVETPILKLVKDKARKNGTEVVFMHINQDVG